MPPRHNPTAQNLASVLLRRFVKAVRSNRPMSIADVLVARPFLGLNILRVVLRPVAARRKTDLMTERKQRHLPEQVRRPSGIFSSFTAVAFSSHHQQLKVEAPATLRRISVMDLDSRGPWLSVGPDCFSRLCLSGATGPGPQQVKCWAHFQFCLQG